jgi:phosphate transport system substrate-binding protein
MITRRDGLLAVSLGAALALLAACGQSPGKAAASAAIAGAGATFPAPLYAKWAEAYRAETGAVVNYQPIGSGGGVKQIKAATVDFGGTDKPLKLDELTAAGLYQFPVVMGGVVPIVNAPGVAGGQLKLDGALLADIYLGVVKRWDDPRIKALNPGVALPNTAITVVHRSDGSGTSFLFTTYLTMVSPAWAAKVGASDAVSWPTGLGGKGNDGVAAFVRQTAGSVGYVEYAYAKQNGLAWASLKNAAGTMAAPSAASFAAAAAGADWANAPGNYLLLIDQPGPESWPITGVTFILVPKAQKDAAKGKAVLAFFDWAYRQGDAQAAALDFVPMPEAVKGRVRAQWASEIAGSDGKPLYAPPKA